MFSDENKERIVKATEIAKTLTHYLWIPTILLVGWSASNPKPNIVRLISPLA